MNTNRIKLVLIFLVGLFGATWFFGTASLVSAQTPVITFTVNPATISSGGTSTLSWSVTSATACTSTSTNAGYNNWNNGTLSGSTNITNITATTSFTLDCNNAGKNPASLTRTVTVGAATPTPTPVAPPTATLTANPTTVSYLGSTTLTWSSSGASNCTSYSTAADGSSPFTNWSNGQLSGSTQPKNITQNVTFSLVCTNSGGSVQKDVLVTVAATPTPTPVPTGPIITSFTATPTTVPSGGASKFQWGSQNATVCNGTTDNGSFTGWSGGQTNNVTFINNITQTTTFTLICSNGSGANSAPASVTITVSGSGGTPTPIPTATPVPRGPWFQVNGRVHSNTGIGSSISVDLPSATTFFNNAIKAITSAASSIAVKVTGNPSNNISAPTPAPVIEQYANAALDDVSYDSLYNKALTASPTPFPQANINFNALTPGVYLAGDRFTVGTGVDAGQGPQGDIHVQNGTAVTIFVDGTTAVRSNVIVDPGGFFAIISRGPIYVYPFVTRVDGLYFTDKDFCTTCNIDGQRI